MPKIKEKVVSKILFSQDFPVSYEKSPYAELVKKYQVTIDFFKFFKVEAVGVAKFRKSGLCISDYTAMIITSKYAVDHFFRIVKELKITLSQDVCFFCINEIAADYLQKYVKISQKKRIFFPPDGDAVSLANLIKENKNNKFLIPCSLDFSMNILIDLLSKRQVDYTRAEVFKIRLRNASEEINIYDYDMLVFFSPYGIQSLMKHYPDYKQDKMIICAVGTRVLAAAEKAGLKVQLTAPTKENPSIFTAIDKYLEKVNGINKYFAKMNEKDNKIIRNKP
jgi:uroporphyrinogen-III synthase